MDLGVLIGHIESDIRIVQIVIGKVLFDHIALVAAAYNKIIHSMRRIYFHNVP